jgi:putative transposase
MEIETSFKNDSAMEKTGSALVQVFRKWTMPQRNWPLMVLQFINMFGLEETVN